MGVVLLVIYSLVALVWRSFLHRRRNGDSASRLAATTSSGKVAAALMIAAHGLAFLGVVTRATATAASLVALGVAVFAVGFVLVVRAQAAMGASWRVGVDPNEQTELVTQGLFTTVRNPIFSGMTLCLTGAALASSSSIAAFAVVAFVVGVELQVRFVEEPYLLRVHGQSFTSYARRTGRFVPRLTSSITSRAATR